MQISLVLMHTFCDLVLYLSRETWVYFKHADHLVGNASFCILADRKVEGCFRGLVQVFVLQNRILDRDVYNILGLMLPVGMDAVVRDGGLLSLLLLLKLGLLMHCGFVSEFRCQ